MLQDAESGTTKRFHLQEQTETLRGSELGQYLSYSWLLTNLEIALFIKDSRAFKGNSNTF